MKISKFERVSAILQGAVVSGFISIGIVGVMGNDAIFLLAAFYWIMALILIALGLFHLFAHHVP